MKEDVVKIGVAFLKIAFTGLAAFAALIAVASLEGRNWSRKHGRELTEAKAPEEKNDRDDDLFAQSEKLFSYQAEATVL